MASGVVGDGDFHLRVERKMTHAATAMTATKTPTMIQPNHSANTYAAITTPS
jgi:hypothetical protein